MVSTTFLATAVVMGLVGLAVFAWMERSHPGRDREPRIERRRPWLGARIVRSQRAWYLVAVSMVVVALVTVAGYVLGSVERLVTVGVVIALTLAAVAGWFATAER